MAPYRAILFKGGKLPPPKWCDTPPPLAISFKQAPLRNTPHFGAIPPKNKHKSLENVKF